MCRPVGGLRLQREGDRCLEIVCQPAPIGVVDVDDAMARPRIGEQASLGGEVILHRWMEVEVILGQVGERRDLEVDGVRPTELQGM